MEESIVVDVVKEQFARTWQALREIVQVVPSDEWSRGDTTYEIPARWAYHIVFSADCYSTHLSYEEYKKDRNLKIDWEAFAEKIRGGMCRGASRLEVRVLPGPRDVRACSSKGRVLAPQND